jgi:hypothetical protein
MKEKKLLKIQHVTESAACARYTSKIKSTQNTTVTTSSTNLILPKVLRMPTTQPVTVLTTSKAFDCCFPAADLLPLQQCRGAARTTLVSCAWFTGVCMPSTV